MLLCAKMLIVDMGFMFALSPLLDNILKRYDSTLLQTLKNESSECYKSGTEGAASSSWPRWFSFPFLSRLCFTLGNLTTTNSTNRKLLATDTELLVGITTLLQYCVAKLHDEPLSQHADEDAVEEAGAAAHNTSTNDVAEVCSLPMLKKTALNSDLSVGRGQTC